MPITWQQHFFQEVNKWQFPHLRLIFFFNLFGWFFLQIRDTLLLEIHGKLNFETSKVFQVMKAEW